MCLNYVCFSLSILSKTIATKPATLLGNILALSIYVRREFYKFTTVFAPSQIISLRVKRAVLHVVRRFP